MSLGDLDQENKFKKHLGQFWQSKGITQIKIPQIGGQELNLYKLYKSVCRKGGGQTVSHNKMWKEIVDEFGLPSTCTSASFTLKNHYQRYLLAFEQKYYFGRDDNADLPQLVAGRLRKTIGRGDEALNINKFQSLMKMDNEPMQQSTLQSDLSRYYDKADKNQTINYIKRSKIYPVTSQVKHIMLGFQSGITEEVIYSINILTMFSVNTEAPFLFHQYPSMLDSINSYVVKSYPITNITSLECLRNLTLALRNLMINIKNLSPLLESPLLNTLLKIFTDKSDREITRNIVDIFSSMTKVGWNCRQLTLMIEQYLQKDTTQDLETGIDLLRAMVQEREELCQDIITRKLDLFSRLLVHASIDNREAVLEIFAYIIQKSQKIRSIVINNYKFMSRIIGFISCSSGINQKQAQLAGFILGSITHTKENLQILKKFEKDLMLVSFDDDNLSSVTTSLLYSINNPIKDTKDNHISQKQDAKQDQQHQDRQVQPNQKQQQQQ